MLKYINIKLFSVILVSLFSFNIYFQVNSFGKNTPVKKSITEQFFSTINFSSDIVFNMLNKKNIPQKDSSEKKEVKKTTEYILPLSVSYNKELMFLYNIGNAVKVFKDFGYPDIPIEYPLKIPFLFGIFFILLIIKIINDKLPRAVPVFCDIKTYKRTCIAF